MAKNSEYDLCMIGLGPVGVVSGLCFAKQGFRVVGVDIRPERIAAFARNEAPFVEPGVNELVAETQAAGTFTATTDFAGAVSNSRILMICVGTPTPVDSGEPDLSFLDRVAESLGKSIRKGAIIVLRSTVPPGTLRWRLGPIIEHHCGLKAGVDFHLAANPEFLREGMAIHDFFHTGRVVIGAENQAAIAAIAALYRDVSGERIVTSIESAEFAKYVDNSWHALKVAFANEIGRTVLAFGGDVEETTHIFLSDDRLNISAKYLRPGFAFGGSCLPKDVRGLQWLAREYGVTLPVVEAILPSNEEQIRQGIQAILATGAARVGLLGMAFKAGVDDVRESPALFVAQGLRARGIEIFCHDVSLAEGAEIALPDGVILPIMRLEKIVQTAQALAKFYHAPEYDVLATGSVPMLDLTRVVQHKLQ